MKSVSQKSRLVAFLLVFFVGMFGAHRFYAGKTGSAIAQLILTLTFFGAIISGIWVIVDFFTILLGGFVDGSGKVISMWTPEVQEAAAASGGADELAKYAELREKGVITEDEFKKKKSELLG